MRSNQDLQTHLHRIKSFVDNLDNTLDTKSCGKHSILPMASLLFFLLEIKSLIKLKSNKKKSKIEEITIMVAFYCLSDRINWRVRQTHGNINERVPLVEKNVSPLHTLFNLFQIMGLLLFYYLYIQLLFLHTIG